MTTCAPGRPRGSAQALIALLCCAAPLAPAQAHPHFRFTYQIEPVHSIEGVVGLHLHWWVDADASAQIRQAADSNRDGQLDGSELAAFARSNDRLLRMQRYFLRATVPGADAPLEFAVQTPLQAQDQGEQGIHLSLELRFGAAVAAGAFSVRLFDPTWNVALAPHRLVLAQPGCQARLQEETLATVGWGEQRIDTLHIQCAPAQPVRAVAHLLPTPRTGPKEIEK